MVAIEPVTSKEEVTALRALLHESLSELQYLQDSHPRIASSQISSILERGTVALRVTDLRAAFRP